MTTPELARPSRAAPDQAPEPSAVATAVFGERLGLARQFALRLGGDGVQRGVIGPREVPRLWERHLLNCAVLTELLPAGARLVDVGSGAGLPGIAVAIRRPDVRVDLLEPLQRRVAFLDELVRDLGLEDTVRVVRGRAEEPSVIEELGGGEWVTARAVAPLDRLVGWCLPLVRPGGRLLALKGASAAEELAAHRVPIERAGGGEVDTVRCGVGLLTEPTVVVLVQRGVTRASEPRPRRGARG